MLRTLPAARPATRADAVQIAELVATHARRGEVLPRTLGAIQASIADWVVVDHRGQIVAAGSLFVYGPALAEVRSLVVHDDHKRHGYGRLVVRQLITVARQRGFHTLFALTRVVPFFLRLGFSVTDRDHFPDKIWKDCTQCPLLNDCDETAVAMQINPVP